MSQVFQTATKDAELRAGYVTLPSGAEVSQRPLWDVSAGVWARMTLVGARDWCRVNGHRLPTVAELREYHDFAPWIPPVTLPAGSQMGSLAYARRHDETCSAYLADHADDPIVNIGKHWSSPDGALFGWRKTEGGDFWQTPYTGHGGFHADYSSTVYVVRTAKPDAIVPPDSDTDPGSGPPSAMAKTFGEAVLDRARIDLAAGVREDLGKNDGHRIREYTARHGRPGGGLNWCAAAVSAWIAEAAEATGVEAPIAGSLGAQATMAQLRAVGLFTEAADVTPDDVRPGCVPVWNRAQPGRPSTSWWGHVGVCVGLNPDGKTFTSIEGNAGPTGEVVYRNTKRRLDDPRLFGLGQLDDVPVPLAAAACEICEGVGWTWVALDDSNDSRTPCPKCDPPDEPEPIHEGSDPVDEAARLYAEWLGLPTLADPLGGVD